jgi:hypothetical protein
MFSQISLPEMNTDHDLMYGAYKICEDDNETIHQEPKFFRNYNRLEVADELARQAVKSSTVHEQMAVANDHRILARQAMVKQWQHVWRTGDTGRFTHAIRPVDSVKPWIDGQERSFVTTISRVMSGHCSIRAHLERFKIVGDPICVCMMNYETVDHIIWECCRFEDERRQLLLGLAAVNIKKEHQSGISARFRSGQH